jgi:uncharacterized protein (TIGR02270 family)
VAKAKFIEDIVEEHHEELAFLWRRRQAALRSPIYSVQAFAKLEERIEAHVQGLLVPGDDIFPRLKQGLIADDPDFVFSSAYALLRSETKAGAELVVEALSDAQPNQLNGIGLALCHGSIKLILPKLQGMFSAGAPLIAAVAAVSLGCHDQLDKNSARLTELIGNENPAVRLTIWSLAARVGWFPDSDAFNVAAKDKDPELCFQAWLAAASTRQRWLLDALRKQISLAAPESMSLAVLNAVLATPDDAPRVLDVARSSKFAPLCYPIIGALGSPAAMDKLLVDLKDPNRRRAIAAGAAFRKMTGCDIESSQRVQLPPEDGHEPDEFEQKFLEEVKQPDVEKARNHWSKVKPQVTGFTRVCGGFDMNAPLDDCVLNQLDMESRWESHLRSKFQGTWQGKLWDLEKFPQPRASKTSE